MNEATLHAWLSSWNGQWSPKTSADHARFVHRFLNWLVTRQAIAVNPIADLCRRYECRSVAVVTKAWLSPNAAESLEALRPLQRYGSHLGPAMRAHVERMRTLGFRYGHECRFLRFDRYLQQRPGAELELLKGLVEEYVALAPTVAEKLLRIGVGRVLARALNRSGIPTALPKWNRKLVQDAYRIRRRPYIYTPEQIDQLFRIARSFSCRSVPLRPQMLHAMLVLAYCAGLRIGEIVRLTLQDLDLAEGSIEVRETKFFKSRRLPLSTSAVSALRDYLQERRRAGAPENPEAPLWWHKTGAYSQIMVQMLLREVIRRAGLNHGAGRAEPRVHDLRHTFVVHRMTDWYREGINPQRLLPYLAAYLGHRDVNSTLVYLTITQELLQLASQRFRTAEEDVLKVVPGEF